MSLPALTGCISQGAAAAVSAPSGVSIATTASGDYDNAIRVLSKAEGNLSEDGSHFDSNTVTVTMAAGEMRDMDVFFHGYIRATGATSYLWSLSGLTINVWGGLSGGDPGINPQLIGGAATTQDTTSTGGLGIGQYVNFLTSPNTNPGPPTPDGFTVKIDATATNSGGSTSATQLTFIVVFTI